MPRASRAAPLLHRARWAHMQPGFFPSLDETRGSDHVQQISDGTATGRIEKCRSHPGERPPTIIAGFPSRLSIKCQVNRESLLSCKIPFLMSESQAPAGIAVYRHYKIDAAEIWSAHAQCLMVCALTRGEPIAGRNRSLRLADPKLTPRLGTHLGTGEDFITKCLTISIRCVILMAERESVHPL
jgi:hypothetical protein